MEERKGTKVTLTTGVLFFLVIVIIIGIALVYIGLTEKHNTEKAEMQEKLNELQGQVAELEKEKDNKTENSEKENTIISLSDQEKININEELRNYIVLPLRQITDVENCEEIKYNVNLISSEENKYFIVLSTMKEEIPMEFKAINVEGENVTGAASISLDRINEYYKKIFGCDMNKQELINSNIPYGVQIKDGMLYGSYPTGWGINPFELKVESILKDNKTGVYNLNAKVIMKIINQTTGDIGFDENVAFKYGEPNCLTWPDEYNYANLEIQYKKDKNGNNQLVSLMFVD